MKLTKKEIQKLQLIGLEEILKQAFCFKSEKVIDARNLNLKGYSIYLSMMEAESIDNSFQKAESVSNCNQKAVDIFNSSQLADKISNTMQVATEIRNKHQRII